MTTLFSEQHEDRVDGPDRLPPGQRLTEQWPVLTYGATPRVELRDWSLRVWGEVEREVEWNWEQFQALGTEERSNDIHCVTHWSRFDNNWEGVLIETILRQVRPTPRAAAVMFHSYGGYTTNVSLDALAQDDHAMIAFSHDGEPIPAVHGGPVRAVVPLAVLLEERQVAAGHRDPAHGSARLLGDVRLSPARRPLGRRALLVAPPTP